MRGILTYCVARTVWCDHALETLDTGQTGASLGCQSRIAPKIEIRTSDPAKPSPLSPTEVKLTL